MKPQDGSKFKGCYSKTKMLAKPKTEEIYKNEGPSSIDDVGNMESSHVQTNENCEKQDSFVKPENCNEAVIDNNPKVPSTSVAHGNSIIAASVSKVDNTDNETLSECVVVDVNNGNEVIQEGSDCEEYCGTSIQLTDLWNQTTSPIEQQCNCQEEDVPTQETIACAIHTCPRRSTRRIWSRRRRGSDHSSNSSYISNRCIKLILLMAWCNPIFGIIVVKLVYRSKANLADQRYLQANRDCHMAAGVAIAGIVVMVTCVVYLATRSGSGIVTNNILKANGKTIKNKSIFYVHNESNKDTDADHSGNAQSYFQDENNRQEYITTRPTNTFATALPFFNHFPNRAVGSSKEYLNETHVKFTYESGNVKIRDFSNSQR